MQSINALRGIACIGGELELIIPSAIACECPSPLVYGSIFASDA